MTKWEYRMLTVDRAETKTSIDKLNLLAFSDSGSETSVIVAVLKREKTK